MFIDPQQALWDTFWQTWVYGCQSIDPSLGITHPSLQATHIRHVSLVWHVGTPAPVFSAHGTILPCCLNLRFSHPFKAQARDFPSGPVGKMSPPSAGSVGLIPGQGTKIPHASWPKKQNIKQKHYCNKSSKYFLKNSPHQKHLTKKKKSRSNITAAAAAAKSLWSCPTLCDPTDSSTPGSPIPGSLQARTLE